MCSSLTLVTTTVVFPVGPFQGGLLSEGVHLRERTKSSPIHRVALPAYTLSVPPYRRYCRYSTSVVQRCAAILPPDKKNLSGGGFHAGGAGTRTNCDVGPGKRKIATVYSTIVECNNQMPSSRMGQIWSTTANMQETCLRRRLCGDRTGLNEKGDEPGESDIKEYLLAALDVDMSLCSPPRETAAKQCLLVPDLILN